MPVRYETVDLQWLDDPSRTFSALVGIGEWDQDEEDERVFYYFESEEQFELAKQANGIDDFRVIGEAKEANYVYIFDCLNCGNFYGEQSLTTAGELLCPNCYAPERVESPFVERMAVLNTPKPFEREDN
jgi:hypothetical protein